MLHVVDLAILSAAAGRIAKITDQLLPPNVYSCRLRKKPPFWEFTNRRRAWKRYLASTREPLKRGDAQALGRFDVANYFGSLDAGVLETSLHGWGCDSYAVELLVRLMRVWQSRDHLSGLPIGTDAGRLIGNAFLLPLDQKLTALGIHHRRWMDDVLIPGKNPGACRSAIGPFDDTLAELMLRRSVPKTEFFDDPESALKALSEDEVIVSLEAGCDDEDRAADKIHAAFDREILHGGKVKVARLHWLLGALTRRKDAYAVTSLSSNQRVMNIDPRYTGDYFCAIGVRGGNVADNLFATISAPSADSTDALHLHVLRALSTTHRAWGTAEAKVFQNIATDEGRRVPTRCWAWRAAARATKWREREVLDGTEAERDPWVRRAMLSTVERAPRTPTCRRFYRHARDRFPDLRETIRWLEAK